MNAQAAWHTLADRALSASAEGTADRLAVYDALAMLGYAAGLNDDAQEAAATAQALRGAETLELDFRNRLRKRGGNGEKGPQP